MTSQYIKIWDGWIRLFHWLLAASILFLLFSGQTGVLFYEWHRQIGEFVVALVLFRVIWGSFGSSNAGLLSLFANPKSVYSHLLELFRGRVSPARGHNAAGGWAVLLMLVLVAFQAGSGMLIADEEELLEGRFYGLLSESTTATLWDLHLSNANILLSIVLLHVVMIFIYFIRARVNLLSAMISGKVKWPNDVSAPPFQDSQWWLAPTFACLIFAASAWVFNWF